jgi:hypothetical protein
MVKKFLSQAEINNNLSPELKKQPKNKLILNPLSINREFQVQMAIEVR